MPRLPTPDSMLAERLAAAGIQPSAQRLAIGEYVLFTEDHPSADEVLARLTANGRCIPMISRATVYNTLNLFVRKGLLRDLVIEEGHVVFDPRLDVHHHFVDTKSGRIFDLPAGSVPLGHIQGLDGFDVHEVQVVVRGTRRRSAEDPESDPERRGEQSQSRTRSRFGRKPGRRARQN